MKRQKKWTVRMVEPNGQIRIGKCWYLGAYIEDYFTGYTYDIIGIDEKEREVIAVRSKEQSCV